MKKSVFIAILFLSFFSCKEKQDDVVKGQLTDSIKRALITELNEMKANDQKNRSYISLGTFNENLIDSVNKLSIKDLISFKQSYRSEISKAQEDSLWSIQNKIDLNNTNRLYDIIKQYGWVNKTMLDSVVDPMIFLFHTPMETIDKMQALLLEEVNAKRLEPIKYATYVDNMRKKAYGKNQLYGTGDEFDPKTNKIVPPFIEDVENTNLERIKIGLAKLKKGEYRTSK